MTTPLELVRLAQAGALWAATAPANDVARRGCPSRREAYRMALDVLRRAPTGNEMVALQHAAREATER